MIAIQAVMLVACSPNGAAAKPWIDVLTYPASAEAGGDTALLDGVLANVGGCLVVQAAAGVTLPYFPSNAVSYPSTDSVQIFGTTYRIGDSVSLGGGYGTPTGQPAVPTVCADAITAAAGAGTSFIVAQQ